MFTDLGVRHEKFEVKLSHHEDVAVLLMTKGIPQSGLTRPV